MSASAAAAASSSYSSRDSVSGCDNKRKLGENQHPKDILNEVSRTHQAIQSLDKAVSTLEMEMAVERARSAAAWHPAGVLPRRPSSWSASTRPSPAGSGATRSGTPGSPEGIS
ncbi:Mitotic spindle checkpoint protein MAD1 [Zea mays]|nr:Mitotic spindle checkpoint protein MAD1 [Zea mays]